MNDIKKQTFKMDVSMQYLFYIAIFICSFDIFFVIDIKGFTVRLALLVLIIPMAFILLRTFMKKEAIRPIAFYPLLIWTFFIIAFIPNTNFLLRNIGYAVWLIFYVLLVFITVQLFQTQRQYRQLIKIYLASFFAVSAFGILQFILAIIGLEPPLITQWWPNGLPRINGFSYEPSYYATYLITGWSLSLYLVEKRSTLFNKKFICLTLILTTIALILSSSRMGYIIMALWVMKYPILFILRKRTNFRLMLKRIFLIVILLVLITIIAFGFIDFKNVRFLFEGLGLFGTASHSSSTRITFLVYTLHTFFESPLIGYSLGGIPSAIGELSNIVVNNQTLANKYEGMNVTAEVLAASGIFGFIFFSAFIILLFVKPLLASKRITNREDWILLRGLAFSFLFLLLILQFNQNILRPYFWIHIAVLAASFQFILKRERKTKKRFLIDARMWNHSGIGTYIRALVPRVIENFPNISFTLIIEKGSTIEGDISNKNNVDFIAFSSSIYSIKEQIEFIIKTYGRFDYLWSPHYNIPIFFDGQLFVTVHDVFHLAFPEYNKGLKKAYAKLLFTIIKFKAKKIFTVSDFTKQELVKYAGVNPEKIIPVPNGIEDEWLDLPVTEPLLDKPYLLYVGNVKPHKNLISLIKAFKLIAGKIDHQLVIVGKKEGFITGDMEVLKASEELGDRVLFTGFISDDILKRYYQHAEVLVFPSLYEGFGLPPLEAMAVNCPTIVSNKASIPEVCGDASLYVDPLNSEDISKKILLIISNNQVRNELILKGQNHVKKYSWQITASKIIGTFDEVLK